ncbi:TPA: hypothetical protein N0F65_010483 [Lagenidium giganteum]|uniref:Macro domain-containing protein n=1 Tax=Lagenidium giganteum TaxID=4803 RepID=A0AAV2ZBT1_9STRA|nr:TPA: hypothetical protein N0F65_010483 [Lagenidium giganteum]
MLDSKKWGRWLCNSYGVDAAQVKALGVPIPPVPHACNELAVSISAHRQWQQFHSNVYILKGDLGTIMHVKGHPVDCLAFPTSAGLTNPGVGVAAVVHDRAGPVLSNFALDYVQSKSQRGWSYHGVEEVFVSPGFKTGMKCLVHCIGPSYHVHGSARLLYNSYAKALLAIRKRNDVTCVAFASISTGILRYPYEPAAMCAMQALRDVIRLHPWPIKVAIVCFEPDALTAFETAKETVEATFFTAPVAYPEVFQ